MAKKIEAVEVADFSKKSAAGMDDDGVSKSNADRGDTNSIKSKDSGTLTFIKRNFLLIFAIFYLLFPIDFIPDFLPVIGYGDDVSLLIIGLLRSYSEYKKGKPME